MTIRNATRSAAAILATLDSVGGKLDKITAAEYAKVADLAERVASLDVRHDIPGAVLASLEAGNDPATDPNVLLEATRAAIASSRNDIDGALALRAQRFIDEHAETILEGFRTPFEKAAEKLGTAYERIGDVALRDTEKILRDGGDIAEVWAAAQTAEATIRTIHQTWGMVAMSVRTIDYDPQYRLLVVADVPPSAYHDKGLRGKDMAAWEILRAGYRLDLATPQTLRDRIAGLGHEAQRRQTEAAGAFTREHRRTRGTGVVMTP